MLHCKSFVFVLGMLGFLGFSPFGAFAQNETVGKTDDSFLRPAEDISPFEKPINNRLSEEVKKHHADLLSKLYEEKNVSEQLLKKLTDEKQVELDVLLNKDIDLLNELNKKIRQEEATKDGLTKDINDLKIIFSEKVSNKQVSKIIERIQNRRYPQEKDIVTEQSWNTEFQGMSKIMRNDDMYSTNDCEIAFDGIDPTTLQKKVMTSSQTLINYTHPKLEAFYKEESFLTGKVSLVQLGKQTFLVLDVTIKSRDAMKHYGYIQVNSPLKIEFIDGESAYLFAQTNAAGNHIPLTKSIKYQAMYPLTKTDIKSLGKSEIDNIGLMWSSGYENYDIYNIDVVMNQIECLQKSQ